MKPINRRNFLQQAAGLGGSLLHASVPESSRIAASEHGKRVTLLHDGGFEGDAWVWQFSDGASIDRTVARAGQASLRVRTKTGDYARFLVGNPRAGARYTLSGWVRTEGVSPTVPGGGAFYAAPQFEFQGRPAQFTAGGLIEEQHLGNITGDSGWTRFQHTFTCSKGATWIEVTLGVYRATGTAWFDDVTFVSDDQAAEFKDVVEPHTAAQWAHERALAKSGGRAPRAAILRDTLPVRGAASDPVHLASLLQNSYQPAFLTAAELADRQRFSRDSFDLLVLPYGETFPLEAEASVREFLAAGGDLFTTGGYAFQSPVVRTPQGWSFDDEQVWREQSENLIPTGDFSRSLKELQSAGWSLSSPEACQFDSSQMIARVTIPAGSWNQSADWRIDVKASGLAKRFYFEAKVRSASLGAEQGGFAHVSLEQLDARGRAVYATPAEVVQITSAQEWRTVRDMIALAPSTQTLRVRFGLTRATGVVEVTGIRLEARSREPRINTAKGFPQDLLDVEPEQIGMFDPDYRLQRTAWLEPAAKQAVFPKPLRVNGNLGGFAACGVLGINHTRWIPLLNARDRFGRLRGAAGALMHHYAGVYGRSSWAFFGVDTADIFAGGELNEFVRAVARSLVRKCYLHELETDLASYRDGEPVRVRTLVSNFGARTQTLRAEFEISPVEGGKPVFRTARTISVVPGETAAVMVAWEPPRFALSSYQVKTRLLSGAERIDEAETGFLVWKDEALRSGGRVGFRNNYMQLGEKPTFVQGTDDYAYMFLNRSENPLTWEAAAYGCRDACVDIYENLMGLRGPQQNPPREWWRWIDGMLLSVSRAGGVFMPGMLIFSNTAVGDFDLAEQRQFCRKFAERYRQAPGLIYYLNGDLELRDPNLPDLQNRYRQYLRSKYGSDEGLRQAWRLSPPEAPLDRLAIGRGTDQWRDLRRLDDTQFRIDLVDRWLSSLSAAIRDVDDSHPITAEFYQSSNRGIDLITASGALTFANFGYFGQREGDRRRFPSVLRLLDQRLRGKGAHVGEFGVKTHPGWAKATSYLQARTEQYEQDYFLEFTHTAFGQGATKIQNWSWKYPADLTFDWGLNYPCDNVPRDVLAYYRNAGLLFRYFRPKYEPPEVVFLLPDQMRKGGQSSQFHEGLLNGIRLLIDLRVEFGVLEDVALDKLPSGAKVILYPMSYCPSDAIVDRLASFVRQGGRLYLSGDPSYDTSRQRTKLSRLEQLCGVEFERQIYPDISFDAALTPVRAAGGSGWPDYQGAPGLRVRPRQATVLAAAPDGMLAVVEHKLGAGLVIYTPDPVELHFPAQHSGGLQFYAALIKRLGVSQAAVEPAGAPLHAYRVATETGEAVHIVVNYGDETLSGVRVLTAGAPVSLGLAPHRPGMLALNAAQEPIAVESIGEVRYGPELLLASTVHIMMIAGDRRAISKSRTLLLLPMGVGRIRIPNAGRWHKPTVYVGALERGRWARYEVFQPRVTDGVAEIEIDQDRNLSMLWIAEAGSEKSVADLAETWVLRPWALQ